MSNGSTIVSTTLPTIIGMGVVSETTKTILGRGRRTGVRGTRSTRAVARPDARKFNGKTYRAANWHTTKEIAERDAVHLKRAGHLARVVRHYNERLGRWGYTVYTA